MTGGLARLTYAITAEDEVRKATGSHPPSEIPSPALGSACGDRPNYPRTGTGFPGI